jgi:hypothetical protein
MPAGMQGLEKGAGNMAAIEGIGRTTSTRPGHRATGPGEAGFALPPEASAAGKMASTAAVPVASLASMLTLQELGGETAEDRDARRRGHDLLALLGGLQRSLLAGSDDEDALTRLAELAAAVPLATDRRLAAMISAITVRVRVELARRQS